LGLGKLRRDSLAAGETLSVVRNAAEDARRLLTRNRDPIDERDRQADGACGGDASGDAATIGGRATLRRYMREYHRKHVEPVRGFKHACQWINSIEQHVPVALLDATIDRITAVDLLDELVPILRKLPETGSRIYQRLATIFNAAVIDGLRADNPATPICRELHRRAGRRERRNYSSMPYRQVPAFMQRLRDARGTSPRCLEFAILTAARTSEALTAEWAEFDREARTWTIPAAKMKCHERHVVFLSDRALEILDGQEGLSRRFVFPSLVIRTPMRWNGRIRPLGKRRTTYEG
jgi:integrase